MSADLPPCGNPDTPCGHEYREHDKGGNCMVNDCNCAWHSMPACAPSSPRAELARLRAVEKAAAAYMYTDAGDPQVADRYEELEALIRAGGEL